jgi:hypothetical protein
MRGHRSYGQRDSQPDVQIKADWGQGVNTVLPADRLPPMQFTHGLNIELREGFPVTRSGTPKAKWLYSQEAKLGDVFQGSGMVQSPDPDPRSRLPIATPVVCDNDLWLCAPNNEPTLLYADITDSLQQVEFIDAFDYTLILRNYGLAPLRYRYEAGHLPEAIPAARSGMTTLPDSPTGCYAGNRIWLKKGKNEVIASDLLEWDYNSTETRWTIDDGENDEIVRLWPVGEDRIVVFKTRSIHVIEGVASLDTASEPPIQITIRRVAAARGCVAPYAIAQRGQTLYYLSRDGIEALLLSDNAVSAMSDKPISVAEARYFDDVKWRAVNGARMTIANNYLILSVPTRYREEDLIPLIGGDFTDTPTEGEIDPDLLESLTLNLSLSWDIEGGTPLVNYVEIPVYFTHRLFPSGAFITLNDRVDIEYRGTVRIWQSGTFEFDGEIRSRGYMNGVWTLPPLARRLSVWVGDVGLVSGTYHTVKDLAANDDSWQTCQWSTQASGADKVHFITGESFPPTGHTAGNRVDLWVYPTGWNLPISFGVPHDAEISNGLIDRDGTSLDFTGDVGQWNVASNDTSVFSYYLDYTTWTASDFINEYQVLGAPGSFNETRVIPDSATQGLRLYFSCGQAGSASNFDIGPIFRTTYNPSVQQGVDPEA